ncbi:Probable flavin-containing monooxygenase 1 [Linum grandiflorum]
MATPNRKSSSSSSSLPCNKVGIIGAGVSGLAALKQLAHYNPMVFEASGYLGGVWKSCSYNSTKLQSPRKEYEFSDFPWPNRDDPTFPSHLEILDYLTSYAQRFDLFKYIHFNTKVVQIRFIGDQTTTASGEYGDILPGRPVWEVAVRPYHSDTIQWHQFEFLVVCTGRYGDVPKIPEYPRNRGPEIFKGKVMHSMDYCKLDREQATELMKGKNVSIIGFKKSAIDLALECAQANQGPEGKACTMVIRTLHWTVPHYWVWGLPFFLFFSTRSSQFINQRPNQNLLRTFLCILFSPLRHAISAFIESYLLHKLPLEKYGLRPEHPFIEDYASCQMAITPVEFFPEAEKGNIRFKRLPSNSKWCFSTDGLQFDDNTKLKADVVILATGYDGKKKLKDIIPQPFSSLLHYPSGLMPLYRGTINPLIPNMGFVGYIESVSNLHTAELRSIWLARLADKKFKLPTVRKMCDQISAEIETMRKTTRFYKRHCISTYSINHSDEICEEMGWSSWRKKHFLAEALSPYGSHDYKQH